MAILQVLQTKEQLMRCWQQSSKEKILERTSWSRALFSRGLSFGLFFLLLAGKECDLCFKQDIQTELRWNGLWIMKLPGPLDPKRCVRKRSQIERTLPVVRNRIGSLHRRLLSPDRKSLFFVVAYRVREAVRIHSWPESVKSIGGSYGFHKVVLL
ncbi:hypothetical protein M0R45_010199 [Rubus argutus]|uniref:Uncharacterized protein n=1 Tax=Rubus argutus TaxID=59490 RepID=A0AAW1Y8V8_RUBAR